MSKSSGRVDRAKAIAAAELVHAESGLIDRRIFVDEEIYRLELQQIFARCWLYLAHESQIPNTGDYVTVNMGVEPVIVSRARDGKINAFINSCRHRGNIVCRADKGNAKGFVCPYHGWAYDNEGKLVGVPGAKDYYHNELDRKAWGLPKVAQVDSYRGLIFGTFDSEAPSLDNYLGDMRWGLDLLLNQGDLVAVPGIARWRLNCNWKFVADNSIGDMYHGITTHRSGIMAGHRGGAGTMTEANDSQGLATSLAMFRPDRGFTVVTEYGHGFNASYIDEKLLDSSSPLSAWRRNPEVVKRMGPKRMRVQRGNMNVFPNLFVNIGSRDLLLHNPLAATQTEAWKTVLVDRNAPPDVQRKQVNASNRHFGPGGVFEQDDGENWIYSTKGCLGPVSQQYDIHYAMGLGHGEVVRQEGTPPIIENLVNEHAQLWLYRCWAEYMAAEGWPQLQTDHLRPEGRL